MSICHMNRRANKNKTDYFISEVGEEAGKEDGDDEEDEFNSKNSGLNNNFQKQ